MDNKENNYGKMEFMREANFRNRIAVFHDKLKRHLTAEYLYVTERKDALESEAVEIRFELEQKDKKLFRKSEQKDTRQYFSPLNLNDINESQKDERMKQLAADLKRLEKEINECEERLSEIKELLQDMEELQEFQQD